MTDAALSRRTLLGATLAASLIPGASAQPARQLRMIVPFPAGGTAGVLPRIIGEKIRASYPGGVVVENRTGVGGNIGAEHVFRAEPDGSIAINQSLYNKLSFDPLQQQAAHPGPRRQRALEPAPRERVAVCDSTVTDTLLALPL